MQGANRFAFKEWAAVCQAILAGRQTVLFRKGGVHERGGRFAVEHDEFWLFATRFHQADDELSPEGRLFLAEAQTRRPAEGLVQLPVYVVVTDVIRVAREEQLLSLRPYHFYDDRVLANRYHYKQPGLTLMVVRAFAPPEPLTVPDSPHFAVCRSWVELPSEFSTAELGPVRSDEEFSEIRSTIVAAVTPSDVA